MTNPVLYGAAYAPNPRRARMMMAEKGITDWQIVNLDIRSGENLSDDMRQRNPLAKVPVLELADGTYLSETPAIMSYIDGLSEPSIAGQSVQAKAIIHMWDRRVENELLNMIISCFQHTSGIFKDRMNPITSWGEECGKQAQAFLPILEQQLSHHEFVAGDHFSVADITAVCAIDFGKAVIQLDIGDEFPAISAWHQRMQARSSYAA